MNFKKIINKISLLTLCLVLFSCSEDPVDELGTGTIIGKVVNSGTNKPMSHVKIETSPVSNTVFTDENGAFVIDKVPSGEYSVKAQVEGYIAAFKPANVRQNQQSNVVFELAVSNVNNKPPGNPVLLTPADNEVLKSTEVIFKWTTKNPDKDPLKFTLELHNDLNNRVEVFENLVDSTFSHKGLQLGVKYFWQVTAYDGFNPIVKSAMGAFKVYKAPLENRILYTRATNENWVIYSVDDSDNEFTLTATTTNSYRPKMNLAANKIAYLQMNGALSDIYIMNRDGTQKQKVTSSVKPNGFNLNEIGFSWPANSDKIYFPSFNKLYRINSNGQGLEMIYETADGSLISEVDVNEVHGIIALKTNDVNGYKSKIYCIDFRGNVRYTVLSDVKGAVSGLQISKDAQQILYAYDTSGAQNAGYVSKSSRLFLYEVSTQTSLNISVDTPVGTNDLEPRFSPNEAQVIFTNTSSDGISQKSVYQRELIPSNTNNKRSIVAKNASMPDWN
ncbi:carboxypeptidase regulatory-like domain-containing protein [Flavobacterium sp. JP2137]|uniref:carboxypeptidase regulatory-like domain-containing protein n=1 Tax=Flavobacterium sp. JP2137 TaxID=3414510 RepID=UPI003D30018A